MIELKPSINQQNNQLKTKGYLVRENGVQSTGSAIKSYAKNAKYTIDAMRGKGDDYSVGKINNLTTKLGSVGIAAVLASMTKNPVAKTMEFAGFASFFAAMTIWPKLFIAAPLKAKTGFNVNQQYVDSYGRRKRFFEDPQYLPWDLYKSDEINKIGDKLNIPKNIENRENHIKEKMKQVATQSNTLWMLTAGFATPLMASLMGNYVSRYAEDVVETTRAKSFIKKAGMKDFTNESQTPLQKIFVNPIANLISSFKKETDSNNLEKSLKSIDEAYDAVFGKSDDSEFEFNKARLLYDDVPSDKMLTQYDSKLGVITVKDAQGNIKRTIKTKNTDGVSIFGNKWKEIPNKLTEALGITPKKYKELITKTMQAGENGITPNEAEVLTDMLIKEFGGAENKGKLGKAMHRMEKILTPSMEELDSAKKSFEDKISTIKSSYEALLKNNSLSVSEKNTINDKIKFIIDNQQTRLADKVVNTKSSWFNPVRILDIIAQHSDETAENVAKSKEVKEYLSQFIHGVTPHQINNNFDDVIKGDFSSETARYSMGVDKFFAPLSDKTKAIFSKDNKFIKSVEDNTSWLWNKLYDVSGEKNKHFESICHWLGKTPSELLTDATKQKGIYKGWLKKVGIAFAALTGITLLAISQFGKTNKYNPDVYRYKNEVKEGK